MRAYGLLAVTALLVISTITSARTDAARAHEWIISALRLPQAHSISTGFGVTVGVIDTGVSATDPDLMGNVLRGTDMSGGTPEGDGLTDIDGHGTAMASLIAGHGHGNGDGVLGIAPAATILPVRNGAHKSVFLPAAIDWAVQNGARVISISTGQAGPDAGLVAAVDRAIAADVIVVAAVGDSPRDKQVLFPAALPGVLAVGGTDRVRNHAAMSVIGAGVLLVAPATEIVADTYHGGYVTVSGTSASTAIVAGATALLRSRFPSWSASQVIRRLETTAIDRGPMGLDDVYGYGLLDIVAALSTGSPGATGSSPTHVGSLSPPEPKNSRPDSESAGSIDEIPRRPGARPLPAVVGLSAFLVLLLGGFMLYRVRNRDR